MGRFTQIPQSTFDELQMDAGILLSKFNPASPDVKDEDIITATTGGVNPVASPSFTDWGEDIDNCPNNMLELKHLDEWECTFEFTPITVGSKQTKLAIGAYDVDTETGAVKLRPPSLMKRSDFKDIWWVGDKSNGGFAAVRLKNALSTDGYNLQTTKNEKGQLSVSMTGHVSIKAQDEMPMEFYIVDPDEYTVTYTLSHVTADTDVTSVFEGQSFDTALTVAEGYTMSAPTVTMGGTAVKDAYDEETGRISIPNVTGDIVITASATTTGA